LSGNSETITIIDTLCATTARTGNGNSNDALKAARKTRQDVPPATYSVDHMAICCQRFCRLDWYDTREGEARFVEIRFFRELGILLVLLFFAGATALLNESIVNSGGPQGVDLLAGALLFSLGVFTVYFFFVRRPEHG